MADLLDDWLRARDGATLQRAWMALPTLPVDAAPKATGSWYYNGHGAARLAADLLGWDGARLAWLGARPSEMTRLGAPPVVTNSRKASHCFLEREFDRRETWDERWELREQREGPRVVQWLNVSFSVNDGSRDGQGSGGTAVRIADLEAGLGATVLLSSPRASVVARDPARLEGLAVRARAALDVFEDSVSCDLPPPYARAAVLPWFAAACAGFDPAFVDAAAWLWPPHEVRILRNRHGVTDGQQVKLRVGSPAEPTRGFTVVEITPAAAESTTPCSVFVELTAEGLADGCFVEMGLQEVKAPRRPALRALVRLRGPRRALEAVSARLLAVAPRGVQP